MRLIALALLLAACRPEDSAGQPVPDFGGNLGQTAPDMARDLGAPPDARHVIDLATIDG